MSQKNKHLVVVSIDAMVTRDLEYAKTLPNFKRILDGASVIRNVRTIYPTLTHPVHATLISGAPAGKTGVYNNIVYDPEHPEANVVWLNDLAQVKCDTLIHAAKREGLSVATSTWPMTTYGSEFIDYLIPNAFDFYFDGMQDRPLDAYRALGAGENVIDFIAYAVEKCGFKDVHPEVDFFQFYCMQGIVKNYKPNLLLMHPGNVDAARHKYGVFGEHVFEALREVDDMLGMLLGALEDAGILENTDIVLLSDHGQIGVTRNVSPNVYLRDAGFIDLDENGKVKDWLAFTKNAGGSAHVYLKNPDDKVTYEAVYKLLSDMAEAGMYGFEKVYTLAEVEQKYGLSGAFSFVLETDGYTRFAENICGKAVEGFEYGDYSTGKGTHGYEPFKGPQPVFVAKGPSFKSGVVIPEGDILNHAPTLAKVLGVEICDSEGHAVLELLN